MKLEAVFDKVSQYTALSDEAKALWSELLKTKRYSRGELFVAVGQVPKRVAFVLEGLFSQYFITDKGETVIKYFFPEGRIAGSIAACLTHTPSVFAIEALEDTLVLEYDFHAFRKLAEKFPDDLSIF